MALAAEIPPELFERILFYICRYAYGLLDLGYEVPNRKEAIKEIGACSRTCVYWARACRARIFEIIWLKNYEDMCSFSLLVSKTPRTFTPVSAYVQKVTLLHRIGDRPWLHLCWLQSSRLSLTPGISISYHIVDSRGDTQTPRSIHLRISSGLPRALPSPFHQCDNLRIENPHFRGLNDLNSLMNKFSYRPGPDNSVLLSLSNISWEVDPHFQNDALTETTLAISSLCCVEITIQPSLYGAEIAWLAYVAVLRCIQHRPPSTTLREGTKLQLLPSVQRTIHDIGKALCQNDNVDKFVFSMDMRDTLSLRNQDGKRFYV